MKVLLIGCGAVGISLGTALSQSGAELHLVARGATADAIRAGGLARRGVLGDADVPPDRVRVFSSATEADGPYDFILVSAKTTGNREIAADLAARKVRLLAPGGLLVLCQNGFGNERAFAAFAPQEIYHASFAIGFARTARNVSTVTVFSQQMSIGSLIGAPQSTAAPLAAAIDKGGIPCRTVDNIGQILWTKMLYNCSLNPASALLGVNYGGLVKSESGRALVSEILDEMFAVIHAAGYTTFWPDAAAYKQDFFERILPPTFAHRSSTLQDMERKIPTEIDSLNGAVVRLGAQYHVPTPVNRAVCQLIRAAESNY